MSEEPPVKRPEKIRQIVEQLKDAGITDRGERREGVIDIHSVREEEEIWQQKTVRGRPRQVRVKEGKALIDLNEQQASQIESVAKPDASQEDEKIKERAINKYLEVKDGNLPIVVDAVHEQLPNSAELWQLMKQKYPDLKINEIELSLERIKKFEKKETKSLDYFDQEVLKVRDLYDQDTGLLARQVSQLLDVNTIVAKKPRLWADMNRNWWVRGMAELGEKQIFSREYSRSSRAALFWGLEKIVKRTVGLDEDGKVKGPFLRVALHGMANREGFDIAIAGAKNIADQDLRNKFISRLQEEIKNKGFMVGENEVPQVVLAIQNDPKTKAFAGTEVGLSIYRRKMITHKNQHPPFGEGFNIIQMEISARIRKNKEKRDAFAGILAEVLKDYS
ncbi:hypothetical protein COT75_04715 [Candidatus Beckwithbacteria bacterium CG10_big_fil_rev_8_21_14_0_10_34_10]|uniref:Uncharacterized protein n=1 Tax=Candidatus Beckwithbacteria bacterium CG10_big_fil_rev_8_21_14_0_10_34_10 TaxID=1974495 RepID=A0A2H0W7X4_9BACT|nr:MAG: hypothetical protein COT75_04715 [Candidatus Beckwithbacteria bacterium CG10_big_fil_rev_8_21_14_0_10_34_10]